MDTVLKVVLILAGVVIAFDVGYLIRGIVVWYARRKESNKNKEENDVARENDTEDGDEFLVDDSPVEHIAEEIEEHRKCLSNGRMSKDEIEEHIVSLQVSKTLLAIHAEEYEDCINMYADSPDMYFAIKEEFNDYRVIATRLDTMLDFLIEEYSEQREDIKETIGVKRCGFHEKLTAKS